MIFPPQNYLTQMRSLQEIDLHGTRHADVRRTLDIFIWENMQRNFQEVEVITGHSTKMKKIVAEVVADYGMSYVENWGNPGSVTVALR